MLTSCENPPNGSLDSIGILRVSIQSVPAGTNQGTLHKQVYLQLCKFNQLISFSWLHSRQEVDLRPLHATTNLDRGTRPRYDHIIMWLESRYPLPLKWKVVCAIVSSLGVTGKKTVRNQTLLWNLFLNKSRLPSICAMESIQTNQFR